MMPEPWELTDEQLSRAPSTETWLQMRRYLVKEAVRRYEEYLWPHIEAVLGYLDDTPLCNDPSEQHHRDALEAAHKAIMGGRDGQ